MFGIAEFFFIQDSISFLESRAILTDLSFFMVITAGETKQFSVVSFAFSRCLFQLPSLIRVVRYSGSELTPVSSSIGSVWYLFSFGYRLLNPL